MGVCPFVVCWAAGALFPGRWTGFWVITSSPPPRLSHHVRVNDSETRTQTEPTVAEKALHLATLMEKRNITRAVAGVSIEQLARLLSTTPEVVWQWVDRGVVPEPVIIELGGTRNQDVHGWTEQWMHWLLWSNIYQGRTAGMARPLRVNPWPELGEPEEWATTAAAARELGCTEEKLSSLRDGMHGPPYLLMGAGLFRRYPLSLLRAWEQKVTEHNGRHCPECGVQFLHPSMPPRPDRVRMGARGKCAPCNHRERKALKQAQEHPQAA